MAVKSSAFSCVFSFLKPFRAASPSTAENSDNPASPKSPICREGQEDSSTSAAAPVEHQRKQQQRLFVVSPPVSPFTASVVKETTSCLIDPGSFLIERLEKGWFEENVVAISGWWGVCSTLSWSGGGGGDKGRQGQPTASDLTAWVPTNLPDSELVLGPPVGIRTSILGSSSQQHLFPTIEMASTSGNSFSTNRDPAGLPGSTLRKLTRVFLANKTSLSDGEQRHRPHFRTQSNDPPEALQQFSDKQSKIRNFTKLEKHAGKLEVGSSDKERRRVQKHDCSSMPGAPARRRRKDRKHLSICLTECEYDEFTSLDLNSTKNHYTPPATKEFPGLIFYMGREDSRQQSPNKPPHRSKFHSPKKLTRHPDSPLQNGQIPLNISSDVDMKAHLKFWAHSVASTVSAEC